MADDYPKPGPNEFSAEEEQRMRKAAADPSFVYDDVGARLGQGRMTARPRDKKPRVGPFPMTTGHDD